MKEVQANLRDWKNMRERLDMMVEKSMPQVENAHSRKMPYREDFDKGKFKRNYRGHPLQYEADDDYEYQYR